MKKVIAVFFGSLLFVSLCVGQEDENWLKGFISEADHLHTLSYWEPIKFTPSDIAAGKKRVNLIKAFPPENEWEGIYYGETGIGDNKFVWNVRGGFLSFYFYHTLKSFYFGLVLDRGDFLELDYEKSSKDHVSVRPRFKTKLVKVRVDNTHFLVPEDRLRDFCEKAAGLSTGVDSEYYWRKQEDMQKNVIGLPVLPTRYQKYLRRPIVVEISKVAGKEVVQAGTFPPSTEIHYTLVLNAGRNKKLEEDMSLFIEEIGEWVQLEKVYARSSVGFVRRDADDNRREQCLDGRGGSGEQIPCKHIKVGMSARTRGDL